MPGNLRLASLANLTFATFPAPAGAAKYLGQEIQGRNEDDEVSSVETDCRINNALELEKMPFMTRFPSPDFFLDLQLPDADLPRPFLGQVLSSTL